MAKSKGEGAEVRAAFDGPTIDHDELIDFSLKHNERDRKRASSAGEDRADIKGFLDRTDLNSKALSLFRTLLKVNDRDNGQAKAMDIIRSIEAGLPMVKAHIAGQGSAEMNFDQKADAIADPVEAEPVGDINQFTPDADGDVGAGDDGADLDAEAEDFNAAADALAGNTVQAFN